MPSSCAESSISESGLGSSLSISTLSPAAFSFVTHFDGFQRGVIDTRDLFFFLSVIGFALFATGVILRGHRSG